MRRALIGAALCALVPTLLASDFYVNLATQVLIAAIFASSYNMIAGWGGLISFGHAAFFGAAGYGAALAVLKGGFGHLAAALFGIAFATVLACVIGALALRATGISFLMITLALGQILWGLSYRWVSVTGGDNGLTGLTRPQLLGLSIDGANAYYYFTLAVAFVAFLSIRQFAGSSLGASLRGTRDQPRRMSALGFNVWLIRWLTFVYAGFWAGVAGLLFLYYHRFIGPHSLSIAESAEVLLMVILGGAGTLSGPIVGAAIIVLVRNLVSAYVEHWPMLLGALFLLVIMFVPEGLVPGIATRLRALRASGRKAPAEAPPHA
ncbi:MAG: branched-chain amino acid ABC transporter permease [Bacteroidota bacterium]